MLKKKFIILFLLYLIINTVFGKNYHRLAANMETQLAILSEMTQIIDGIKKKSDYRKVLPLLRSLRAEMRIVVNKYKRMFKPPAALKKINRKYTSKLKFYTKRLNKATRKMKKRLK